MNRDAIQVYAHAKDTSLREAAADLAARCALPTRVLRNQVGAWQNEMVEPTDRLIEYLEDGRFKLLERLSDWKMALTAIGAWYGDDYDCMIRTVCRAASGFDRWHLRHAMSPWPLKTPGYRFHKGVAIPFCDVFNRPRSLVLLDPGGREHFVRLPLGGDDGPDDGLCMLDQLTLSEPMVYSVPGASLALQLMCQHYYVDLRPIRVLGWLPGTGQGSWNSVNARRLLFWAPKVTPQLFNQARRHGSSEVALRPMLNPDEPAVDQLRAMGTDTWSRHVRDSAQPWKPALADHLLGMGDDEQAYHFGLEVDLSTNDVDDILDQREDATERDRLYSILAATDRARSTMVNGREVVCDTRGFSELSSSGNHSPILDAVIHFDRIQVPVSGRQHYLVGHVQRGEDLLPFRSTLDHVQNDTDQWLTQLLLDNQWSMPAINPRWRRHLFHLVQSFHNPPVVRCIDRVGYALGDPELHDSFVAPGFLVRSGQVSDQTGRDVDGVGMPADGLSAPVMPFEVTETEPNRTAALVWGLVSSWISNAEAQRQGAEIKGQIVLAPEEQDVGLQVVRSLARAFCLPIQVYHPELDLHHLDRGHALPPVVDLREIDSEPGVVEYLFDPRPKGLLLVVKNLDLFRSLTLAGWIGFHGMGQEDDFDFHEAVGGWLGMLCASQVDPPDRVPYPWEVLDRYLVGSGDEASRLITNCYRLMMGDCTWQTTSTDRSLFALIYGGGLADIEPEITEVGDVLIRAGRLIDRIRSVVGVRLDLDDIRQRLQRAGWLRGAPGRDIILRRGDFERCRHSYEELAPP